MKISHWHLFALIFLHAYSLQARWHRTFPKNPAREARRLAQWPNTCFNATSGNISITVKALSIHETNNLFLETGKYLVTMRRWFFVEQPIIPIHISIKNENSFPIMISQESIQFSRSWIGIRHEPLNLRNIYESLSNRLFWSEHFFPCSSLIQTINGKIIGALTSYIANKDYLLNCIFFTLNDLTIPLLNNLEPSLLQNPLFAHNSVLIQEGKTKDLLIFAWSKHIQKEFRITIAKNEFRINVYI